MPALNPVAATFLAAVADASAGAPGLCEACVGVLPVRTAAIVLRNGADSLELLCAGDEPTAEVEAAQVTVGEGPGVDAITQATPLLVHDMAATGFRRWPMLVAALHGRTPTAMFAFPLQVGAIRLGVLDLYRDTTEPPTGDDLTKMLAVAQVVTLSLLSGPDGHTAESGQLWWPQSPAARTINQATGMVLAQLGVPAHEAYLRLQGHAFANDMLLADVAVEVVSRRLRFQPD